MSQYRRAPRRTVLFFRAALLAGVLVLSAGVAMSAPGSKNQATAAGKATRLTPAAEAPHPPAPAAEAPHPPTPAIYYLADLTSIEAARLDRQQTLILQPMGIVQTHGPHLPAGTDITLAEALVKETAERLRRQMPDRAVLILPVLPVGTAPANEIGGSFIHPASLGVSAPVLRDLLADWIRGLSDNSFLNVFLISYHFDPEDLRILSQVSDYYSELSLLRMANVTSLVLGDSAEVAHLREIAVRHLGRTTEADPLFDMHGGAAETSLLLAVDPGRVSPNYEEMADCLVSTYEGMRNTAMTPGWLGYFGAPARATTAYGKDLLAALADADARMIGSIVQGVPWASKPRFEAVLGREFDLREVVRASDVYHDRARGMFENWLKDRQEKDKKAKGGGALK